MVKSKIKVPLYAQKAIKKEYVWKLPPCISGEWDEYKTCPANEKECPHAEITRGSIKSAYYAKCNAKKKTLEMIAFYKDFVESHIK